MSLVRALLTESYGESVDLSGYDYTEEATMDTYYTDAALEALVNDIYSSNMAVKTADIMGEVKVIKEGADPAVLLEGIISSGFQKLKDAFKKFLAKIKAWAKKVKDFFKKLFLKGKSLVKEYRREILDKKASSYKYKGWPYTFDKGDALVKEISNKVADEISAFAGDVENARELSYDKIAAKFKKPDVGAGLQKGADDKFPGFTTPAGVHLDPNSEAATDYQDKLITKIGKGANDLTELGENITVLYHDNETDKIEIENFGKNNREQMIRFLENDKPTKDIENDESNFEKDVNAIVKALDKAASETTGQGAKKTDTYPLASKISTYVSAALAVRKKAADTRVSIYKSAYSDFTSILRSFLLSRVKESALDDFNGLIAVAEADSEPAEPEDDAMAEDEGDAAKEGCGGKKSGTSEATSLFEMAYNYM